MLVRQVASSGIEWDVKWTGEVLAEGADAGRGVKTRKVCSLQL